ncbi:hypothetical protein [Flavobacterium sp.]|uniref:hypothetical protein n=1 Tax=Flavobacterium sp. TaxID=239 RepID=UPI00375209C6
MHVVIRVAYPIAIRNQIIEPGIQAYTGKMGFWERTIKRSKVGKQREYFRPKCTSFIGSLSKSFGMQAEYNIGRGTRYYKLTNMVEESYLEGGYLL